jgi:sensor histidine kinase YesM
VGITTHAFNEMKNSIHTYIEQLQEKRRVERNLAEERVKNLEMEHLLKNAEMVSLRTQMNPHFLFNTLNTGVQLAIMEEADRTADFMGDLAVLFRHNVRRMWQRNNLRDEIEGLEYYVKLLKVRFGETYRVHVDIPDDFLDVEFPPMILQPLLENSIIHGFSDTEGGGTVEVRGHREEGRRIVSVKDDGVGMSARSVEEVLRPISYSEEDFSSHSGIGLRNVVLRLRLFFGGPEVVHVVSSPGRGTEVRIRLGQRGEGDV